jgi:acyl carrier protein
MLTDNSTPADIRSAVHRNIRDILKENGLSPTFVDSDRLEALGLASLDLARLVAELEMEFGYDPFAHTPITSVRSIEDVVQAYVTRGVAPGDATVDASLDAVARRARDRRIRSEGG